MNIGIIVPHGFFGASDEDSDLEEKLRVLSVMASPDPDAEWASKYGTDFENEVFMLHRECWCEQEFCPWCAGCTCPPGSWHYFVEDREVDLDEWVAAYDKKLPRSEKHDAVCEYCNGKGPASEHGGEPPAHQAPNFWHKPSGFKVWWYKYIGRSMETNQEPPRMGAMTAVFAECAASIKASQTSTKENP